MCLPGPFAYGCGYGCDIEGAGMAHDYAHDHGFGMMALVLDMFDRDVTVCPAGNTTQTERADPSLLF